MEEHGCHCSVRRFRRLVRPSNGIHRKHVLRGGRLPDGACDLRELCHSAARGRSEEYSRSRPLRLWPAPTAPGGIAWSKRNFVDHTMTDLTSVLRFIEDNWLGGQRIGQGSFDSIASTIAQMFDFNNDEGGDGGDGGKLILDPATGQPAQGGGDE